MFKRKISISLEKEAFGLKRAVVLAGGGSRGAYQIGVWKAMIQLGMDYQIVTGSSVGSLNGALMVQGDYERAKSLWEQLSYENVIAMKEPPQLETERQRRKMFTSFAREALEKGGLDVLPLEELVRQTVDEKSIRRSSVDFGLVTVEYPSFRPVQLEKNQIPAGMLCDYLLASSACFPAFKAKNIDGKAFIDGGYYDNMPVNLALSMGAEEIVAVDLASYGIVRSIPKAAKSFTKIIRSHWELGGFLVFEPETAKRNMRLGYLDAMASFGEYEGVAYKFPIGESAKNAIVLQDGFLEILRRLGFSKETKAANAVHYAPFERMIRFKIFKQLKLGCRTNRRPNVQDVLFAMAEIAGETMGLDPCHLYTFQRFNFELLKAFAAVGHSRFSQIEQELNDLANKQLPNKKLSLFDSKEITSFVYERIGNILEGKAHEGEVRIYSTLTSRELIAALYLWLIQKYDYLYRGDFTDNVFEK